MATLKRLLRTWYDPSNSPCRVSRTWAGKADVPITCVVCAPAFLTDAAVPRAAFGCLWMAAGSGINRFQVSDVNRAGFVGGPNS